MPSSIDYDTAAFGLDDTMEYSLDGGESWNDVGQGETTATLDYSEISADKGVHVRVKEQDGVPPGEAQVLMVASTDVDTEECFVNPGDEQEWGTGDEKIAGLLAGAKYALRIDDGAWNVYESDSSCEIIGLSINSSSMVEVVKVEPQAIGTLRFLSMIQ